MIRSFPTLAAGLTCSMLVAAAQAELPRALDLAPADAVAAIATPSLSQLNSESMQLMNALGLPPVASPTFMLAMLGLQDSVNMDGSAALVLTKVDPEADQPELFVLLPVKDAAATMQALGATPGADGIGQTLLQGETVFMRGVEGGYIALGPQREVIAGLSGKGGNLPKHHAAVGATGDRIASGSDIVFMANVGAMGPIFDKMAEGMKEGAAQAGEGPQAAQAKAMIGAVEQFMTALRRDGRALIGGIDSSAAGVGLDLAVTFNEGSESAKLASQKGKAHDLLGVFPDKPFLFASAYDMSHPLVADWAKRIGGAMQGVNAGMPGVFGMNVLELAGKMTGSATVVYPNPAGMMGGIFANSVTYIASKDPKGLLEASKAAMKQMGAGQGAPFSMAATITPNETQVNGKSVDGWSLAIQPAGDDAQGMQAMQAMQAMTLLFGPGGMSGYLAAADGGMFQTMSKNSQLLGEVMAAGGGGLAKNGAMGQIDAELPSGRIVETYIGVKPIVDMVGPMAQMFIGVPISAPNDLPPVAMGAAANDGAVHGSVFVPMPVIKFASQTAQMMNNMGQGRPAQPGDGEQGQPRRF